MSPRLPAWRSREGAAWSSCHLLWASGKSLYSRGPRLAHVPAAALDFAEANARAPRCLVLVESSVQPWRRSHIPSARQNGGRSEISVDGRLRPTVPQLLSALLRLQRSAPLTVSTCLDRLGLPHPSVAHLCPVASSVLPQFTPAPAPALSPLLLVVGRPVPKPRGACDLHLSSHSLEGPAGFRQTGGSHLTRSSCEATRHHLTFVSTGLTPAAPPAQSCPLRHMCGVPSRGLAMVHQGPWGAGGRM
ncbi:hypothetical protein MC885_008071, partial [Smutsia gigantea]